MPSFGAARSMVQSLRNRNSFAKPVHAKSKGRSGSSNRLWLLLLWHQVVSKLGVLKVAQAGIDRAKKGARTSGEGGLSVGQGWARHVSNKGGEGLALHRRESIARRAH
jgi:hypothetical protein